MAGNVLIKRLQSGIVGYNLNKTVSASSGFTAPCDCYIGFKLPGGTSTGSLFIDDIEFLDWRGYGSHYGGVIIPLCKGQKLSWSGSATLQSAYEVK